ncbi:hypothetical protein LCGC14_2111890 [marine sediment metagenome]|uniref:Uncharacterized protein n=1 Tax=marine sediment metagenome TaxID=412755 RepID=A0A0F9H329_9ZZZZ
MSSGTDSPKQESNNSNINNAILQLTQGVVLLENLLSEIQGKTSPEVASEETKEETPSIVETLKGTASRIYKLSERVGITRNAIRESLF